MTNPSREDGREAIELLAEWAAEPTPWIGWEPTPGSWEARVIEFLNRVRPPVDSGARPKRRRGHRDGLPAVVTLRGEPERWYVILRWLAENNPAALELCPYKASDVTGIGGA